MAEFNAGGGIRPYWRFDSTRLIDSSLFLLLNQLAFVAATVYFTITEIRKLYKLGPISYFTCYWNLAELTIILISYASLGIYIARFLEVKRLTKLFKLTYGNGYIRMEFAALLDQAFIYTIAGIVFFSTLKIFRLLEFNKRMNILGYTLSRCWDELQGFLMAFGLMFFSFNILFFTVFNLQLEEFKDIISTMQMCFAMMLGKFDFDSMARANSMSPVIFFVFSLSTSMILINLMLTIILKAFTDVKNDMKSVPNRYDVLEYMTSKVFEWLGISPKSNLAHTSKPVLNFPDDQLKDPDHFSSKVHELLAYINAVYFKGKLDLEDSKALKALIAKDPTFKNLQTTSVPSRYRTGFSENHHMPSSTDLQDHGLPLTNPLTSENPTFEHVQRTSMHGRHRKGFGANHNMPGASSLLDREFPVTSHVILQ